MKHLAQLTTALAYRWSSDAPSFYWQVAETCKAPLRATSQNPLHHITVSESAALEEQISVGSFTLLLEILLDSISEMVNSSFSVPRQESPVREAFNHAHTCHCSVRTYSWGHSSSITFQERKNPFLCFPFWQRRYTCAAKLKSMGVKHMLECFLELGAQFLTWQWFAERIQGSMEGSVLKVKLTAPILFCSTVVVTTCLKAPQTP